MPGTALRWPWPAGWWSPPLPTDGRWRFSWVAGIGFAALAVIVSYPGRLNVDSLVTLYTTMEPSLVNNWHSATLGWIWGIPGPWLGQPTGALLMQAAMFGVFAGFLPRSSAGLRGKAAMVGELLLRLVLAGSAGYIGKDIVMLLALLIVVQVMRRLPHGRPTMPAIALLVAATTLFLLVKAPNFLTLVVAAALTLPFFLRSLSRYLVAMVAILALGVLAIPLNRVVDAHIFGARDRHPDKQLVLFDLAGISVHTGANAFAGAPGWPTATLPSPQSCYVPYMWDSFAAWANCGGYSRAYDRMDHALVRHWLAQIVAHPLAYLQHRHAYLDYALESRDHATWGIGGETVNDATDPAAATTLRRGRAQLGIDHPIAMWRPSIATAPMRWLEAVTLRFPKVQGLCLVLCLAVLLWNWMRRAGGVSIGAILSAGLGVGNIAMLAVFGVADPARYMLPTMGLAYVALLAMLGAAPRTRTLP